MVFSSLSAVLFIESIFNGSALHRMFSNMPLTAISGLYRRISPIMTVFFCFQWIRFLLGTLPVPQTGIIGRLFKGALVGLIIVEYYGRAWIQPILEKSSYKDVELVL